MNHPTHLEQPRNKDPQCNYHQIALQRVALLVRTTVGPSNSTEEGVGEILVYLCLGERTTITSNPKKQLPIAIVL